LSDETSNKEMDLIEPSGETMKITVGVIFVSLYIILAVIPMSTFIGAGGVSSLLSFSVCIAPLLGIMLGSVRGFAYGFIAGILATIVLLPINGGGVYLIIPTTIIGPGIAGLFTGLLLKGETKLGPLFTAGYLILIIILFEVFKYEAWWFMLPYIVAVFIAILLQFFNIRFDSGRTGIYRYLQLIPFTFVGAMLDHSMMAMGSVFLLDLPALGPFSFATIFPLMLLERLIATVLAALVGFIVLRYFGDVIGFGASREI